MKAIDAALLCLHVMDKPGISTPSQRTYEDARDHAFIYSNLAAADPGLEVDIPEWLEERA